MRLFPNRRQLPLFSKQNHPIVSQEQRSDHEPSGVRNMAKLALVRKPEPIEPRPGEAKWMTSLRQGEAEAWARVRHHGDQSREHLSERATYILAEAVNWLSDLPANSIHAIVTDPPYGVI